MRVWIAALVLLFPLPAAAQDLGARVTPRGLDTLTSIALDRIPPVYSIERMDPVLFDCPGADIVAHIPPTDVSLTFRDLGVVTEDGRIILSTTLDIAAANTIQLDNPNACFGTALCDVSANIDRLGVVVELAASTGPDGGVEFHGATVDIALRSEDLVIDSVGCAIGDVATWLFDAVEAWALDLLTPRLEAAIGSALSAALTDLFSETVGLTIEREGFTIEGWLDSVDLTRLHGITLGGGADITWTGVGVYEDPAPATSAPEGAALPGDFPGDFQLAVSDRLVTDSLYEAWRGGLMRRLLADQSQSIELAGDGLASMIGLEGGTRLDISFDIERPIVATFGRVAADVAELTMEQLHVTIVATPPSGPVSTIEIYASGSAQAALTMNAELGGMIMDVRDMNLTSIRIESTNEALELSGARLSALISGAVVPMLGQRLTGLPVAPGLTPVAGTFIYVRAVESEGGWQRVGADLYVANPDDVMPPDTMLSDPADLLAAGTAAFAVTGTDDSTPAPLLRYRAWLDGTPLNEGAASSLSTVRFDVTGGSHTLEVAAIDLNDNQDPTPVAHVFEVDGNPPLLTVTRSPPPIVTEPTVDATWIASDAEGPIESRWVLREVGDDGMATVVLEAPFGPDDGALSIATDTLRGNTLYELEVIVRDRAGNLASASFGFAREGGGLGCAISPHRRGAPLMLVLLALAGAVLRRRRR